MVFAAFDGGEITSDAGVLLLRERARRIRLFERMAGCFTDHRDRERLTHTLPALLAQRVCGMALGYEDIIERMFCRLKDWRRIATRFDRNIKNFIAAIALAAAVIWWL